jgi:hypothetical protein
MSTASLKKAQTPKSAPPKRAALKKASAKSNAAASSKVASGTAKAESKTDDAKVERIAKQERVLTLLSRAEGASIEEIMQVTGWQQHSVRGFLAGKVKRKLSLPPTSASGKDLPHRDEARSLTCVDKPAIDVEEAVAALSALMIFELCNKRRRLRRTPPV